MCVDFLFFAQHAYIILFYIFSLFNKNKKVKIRKKVDKIEENNYKEKMWEIDVMLFCADAGEGRKTILDNLNSNNTHLT